ncbi:MAG: tRNA (adenosine(37)-N6)-threonylcarbamoyltransferase complex dimerization subunit type 1 TsaB [Lewinellaceae bacterium]|nr:tRNA (adenosine(37)-N6)-threonylcarbamoyltransferase complex dimerization subunit type 1 TsaB [Lewinellaceae bacterium]
MAKILLIETASEVCGAAIAVDGQTIALAEDPDQARHAERLTLLIAECCSQAAFKLSDLDAVAVSRGPGSYTALRVGVSTAKGICFALDKPLIAVDTLQALAAASLLEYGKTQPVSRSPHSVIAIPMLDARRQEVWTAAYDDQLHVAVPAQPLILQHELFEKFLNTIPDYNPETVCVISGNGSKKTEDAGIVENVVFSPVKKCSANYLAGLAEQFFQKNDFQNITHFEPFYMKSPNITTPNKPAF